jgi:hypothetical protein
MAEGKNGTSFGDFFEILCQIRNDQLRTKEEIARLRMEMKLDPTRISFTLKEASAATGFSYSTLYQWGQSGKMKVSQPGGAKGATVVERDELLRMIREGYLTLSVA